MARENVIFRQRKGRILKSHLNQFGSDDNLDETVSLNESAFPRGAEMTSRGATTDTRLTPPAPRKPSPDVDMAASKELVGRSAVGNNSTLKKMASEPNGLMGLLRKDKGNQNNEKTKPNQLENYTVLEEIGDSGYGKVYRVKRLSDGKNFSLKCVAHQMRFPKYGDASNIDCGDAQAMAILIREVLAYYRFSGHPHFLTMHDCWFTVNDLNDSPSTPSLGQPFDLNQFSLNRFTKKCKSNGSDKIDQSDQCSKANMSDYHLSNSTEENEELIDFQLYGNRLLTSLLQEQPLKDTASDNGNMIVVVLYMVLDYFEYNLDDYFTDHQLSTGSELESLESKSEFTQWNFVLGLVNVSLLLYDFDLLHLNLDPSAIELSSLNEHQLVPHLMHFGMNRYFEVYPSSIDHDILSKSTYQAPEIDRARKSINSNIVWPADIYSMGLILVNLCLSRRNKDERNEITTQLRLGNFDILKNLIDIPDGLKSILSKMLALDPDERPTPREILDLLIPVIPPHDFFGMLPLVSRESNHISDKANWVSVTSKEEQSVNDQLSLIREENHIPIPCKIRLTIEMNMLRVRLRFRNWLRTMPDTLWLGVVQSCAKEMLEKYLDQLTDLNLENTDIATVQAISFTIFDVEFVLNKIPLISNIGKCMNNAMTNENQLCKAAIWYLCKKFGDTEETKQDTNGSAREESCLEQMTWREQLNVLYLNMFERDSKL